MDGKNFWKERNGGNEGRKELKLSDFCKSVGKLNIQEPNMDFSLRLEMLKKDVLYVLRQHPEGVRTTEIWNTVTKATGRQISAKTYNVKKLSSLIKDWSAEIEEFGPQNKLLLRLRRAGSQYQARNPGGLNVTDENFPLPSKGSTLSHSVFAKPAQVAGASGHIDDDVEIVEDVEAKTPVDKDNTISKSEGKIVIRLVDLMYANGQCPRNRFNDIFDQYCVKYPDTGTNAKLVDRFNYILRKLASMKFVESLDKGRDFCVSETTKNAIANGVPYWSIFGLEEDIMKNIFQLRQTSAMEVMRSVGLPTNHSAPKPVPTRPQAPVVIEDDSDEGEIIDDDDVSVASSGSSTPNNFYASSHPKNQAAKSQVHGLHPSIIDMVRKSILTITIKPCGIKVAKLIKNYKKIGKNIPGMLYKQNTFREFLVEHCTDILDVQDNKVFLTKVEAPPKQPSSGTSAMSLMSSMSTWGAPATATPNKKPIPSLDFISFGNQNNSRASSVETIDLTAESPRASVPLAAMPLLATPIASPMFNVMGVPIHIPVSIPTPAKIAPGQISGLRMKFRPEALDDSPMKPAQEVSYNETKLGPGFRDEVIDLTVKPVDVTLFERNEVIARPVFIPRGQHASREFVDNIAKECIDTLADANEHVNVERIEKLLVQRMNCYSFRNLGCYKFPDQVPCINEHNRLLNKCNAYILSFVKTRSICTLHELKESLSNYNTNNEKDFSLLKLGPLQRFPIVYQQFQFPPDQAEIPDITSMNVLDQFHNFLTVNQIWQKNLNDQLEPFMNHLVDTYSAPDAFILGVRIRSLPLMAAVLKKAQRDAGQKRREIIDHFKVALKTDIDDSFRKFRATILQTGTSTGMEVRQHYLKMRPELAIQEVFEKFNLLITIIQGNARDNRHGRCLKIARVMHDFTDMMRSDPLGRSVFHLAICMTNLQLEEAAMELVKPTEDKGEEPDTMGAGHDKPPPRKDALVEALKLYIERCLNAGSLSLTHLDRIEQKLLEEFEFSTFFMMGYRSFLEFLLIEAKQMLEEGGGVVLGSSSGGSSDSDSTFKPQQGHVTEFIKQCRQAGRSQPSEIEDALCCHYNVKEVRHLGYGNISRLLSTADKHDRHMYGGDFTVHYQSALVPTTGQAVKTSSKVGILGHQTRDAAKICLHNCPLLENMADWSQWGLVFEPELGKLKDFVMKYGGVTTKNMDGGKLVTLDFLALELSPGHLVKVVSTTSPEYVAKAVEKGDIAGTAGHLVSMVVAYKGVNNMPIALLVGHIKTALLHMHAGESQSSIPGAPTNITAQNTASVFVLKCLLRMPTKISVSLANSIFLDPLGQVVGSTKSKQLLMQLCSTLCTVQELNQLVELGCLLGIQEWTSVIQQKCALPDSAVQILPPDVQEFLGDDNNQDQDEDMAAEIEDDLDTEEVLEEILSGGQTKVKVTQVKDQGTEDGETEVLPDEDITMDDTDTAVMPGSVVDTCETIVNQIRKDEFGVGVHLSEDGQRLMKVQQERLGRSLDRLSKDLYSKDTHFVLELVQNADDNNYHDNLLINGSSDCPSVKFVIDDNAITVLNNELGFREKNIRAICDVGRSTKGKHKFGYIGQKGIGFKSVFRVTDAPEVHSNGFHIKFDVHSGPMGYILPHWVPTEESTDDSWMTKIVLTLKADMRLQTRTLAARFNDIHPSLLLFLHRLRQISIENKIDGSVETMRRNDVGDNVVEIQHGSGMERWLVIKKRLDATKISLQAKSGADVESTEIALAFPLRPHSDRAMVQSLPPKQPVFAFLPLRSYGFRFIVQGDFDVPSSREDVDRDSSWNQWLRNEIHTLFIDSIEDFKTHKEFSAMEAVCTFLQFVPMEDEVLDFFKPVASDILKKLKAKACVPTQPNDQGVVSWKIPSQTVRVRDSLVRSVITSDILQANLNLFYLHDDVATSLNPALTACLGIETLTSEHLFQLGKAMIVKMETPCSAVNMCLISKWLACMYRSLDEFHQDDDILSTLKSLRMFPLSDGQMVSLDEKTVFYPIADTGKTSKKGTKDSLHYLQQDVNSLHPSLLNTEDEEVNSQVQKLLHRLNVKQLSPFDVINHHIIPALKSDMWKKKSRGILISYLVYIKEQTETKPSLCNLDELRDIAQVMTTTGIKNPATQPVHFPLHYGNPVNLQDVYPGYDWTLLDTCYIPSGCTGVNLIRWHDFFSKLGVENFLSVKQKDVQLTKDSLPTSKWTSASSLWPKDEPEYIVKDYTSDELEGLILHNKFPEGPQYQQQMRALCKYLDKHWDTKFSRYTMTNVTDKNNKPLKDTETSFAIILRTAAWLPAVETESKPDEDGMIVIHQQILMKESSCLYIKSQVIERLLSQKVLYVDVSLSGGDFQRFLGLKNTVAIETVKSLLLQWSERKVVDEPTTFYTSLDHIVNVYNYLGDQLSRREYQDLLREKPIYFVPDASSSFFEDNEEISGKMLNRNEIWSADKTGLFDKHRDLLEDFHSEICCKRIISTFYKRDILELFKQEGKIDTQPKIEEYAELLNLLCTSYTPKDVLIRSDVLLIFSTIGEALSTPPDGMPDEDTASMALNTLKTSVKIKLQSQKVFPTKKYTWVSLDDQPMIADNREWENMFADKPGIHFLNMVDKTKGGHHRHKEPQVKKPKGTCIYPEMIDVVLEVCGIPTLSSCVAIEPAPDMISPCPRLQGFLYTIAPIVQQYLMANFETVYQKLEQQDLQNMLQGEAKFYETGKLEVSYRITTLNIFEIRQEKCVIAPPTFYFHRDHLSSVMEINSEIARFFSAGDKECKTALKHFLLELTNIISSVSEETVENLLQRHDADEIIVPEEERWYVEPPAEPAPPEPQPDLEAGSMLEGAPAEFNGNQTETQTGSGSGQQRASGSDLQMRAWPPVKNYLREDQPRERTERPTSNIWPPPQAKAYMMSMRDLPSNIRVGHGDEPPKGDQSDVGGENGAVDEFGRDNDRGHPHGATHGRGGTNEDREVVTSERGVSNRIEGDAISEEGGDSQGTQADNSSKTTNTHYGNKSSEGKRKLSEGSGEMEERHDGKRQQHNTILEEGEHREQTGDTHRSHGHSGTGQRGMTDDRDSTPRRRGDPIWTRMTTDYTYDELGAGNDLCLPTTLALSEGANGDAEIGHWGEELVAQYLHRQKEAGHIIDYIWKNSDEETGGPYDFEVHFGDENGIHTDYIEVKSTARSDKDVFEISVQQIKFADEKKGNFHIYRVFNAGATESVRLIRIYDLNMRLEQKQVKLCILI